MQELFTKIEKLNPHPTEAITLFYNFDDIDVESVCKTVDSLNDKFSENAVIALPDKVTLESCSKDVLENIISMISEIIESLHSDEWIDRKVLTPPINEYVELKFIENGEEKIIEDKLIPMMNGTYIWCHGNYDGCDVISWRRKSC